MAWYDPLLIFAGVIGILMVFFSHHHRRVFLSGIILVLAALIVKAFLWFEGLL